MYSALARGGVCVIGLYDKTSDYRAPSMGERDSFYFTNLCPRLFYFCFLSCSFGCLSLSLHNLFSSAFASSFVLPYHPF